MVSLSDYRLECRGGLYFVVAMQTLPCPLCADVLLELGRRARGYIDAYGEHESVQIRRMICSGCLKIHHELPDFLVPYKRHCAQTVESIVNNKDSKPRSNSGTYKIKAWWLCVAAYFAAILSTLKVSVGAVFSDSLTFKETIRAVVNSNNWVFPGDLSVDLSRPVRKGLSAV